VHTFQFHEGRFSREHYFNEIGKKAFSTFAETCSTILQLEDIDPITTWGRNRTNRKIPVVRLDALLLLLRINLDGSN
jgi:hypothetical protein